MKLMTMRPPGVLTEGLKNFISAVGRTRRLVEIGVFRGEASRLFSQIAFQLYCVDPYTPYIEQNPGNVAGARSLVAAEWEFDRWCQTVVCHVTKIRLCSTAASLLFADASLDGVYIDGNHEFASVLADIGHWWPKVTPGGWIGGHDYGHQSFAGVKDAVDRLFYQPDETFEDFSWLVRRPKVGEGERFGSKPEGERLG